MSAYSAVTGLSSVSSNFFIFLEQSVFKYVVNWLKGKIRDDVFERMADHLYSQGLENTLISVRDQCDTRILLCDR